MTLPTDDHSRVVLSVPDEDGSDYINASFIDVSVLYMYACMLRVVCIHVYALHTSKHSYRHKHNTVLCTLTQGYNHPNKYIAAQGNVQNVDSSICFNLFDNL